MATASRPKHPIYTNGGGARFRAGGRLGTFVADQFVEPRNHLVKLRRFTVHLATPNLRLQRTWPAALLRPECVTISLRGPRR